MAERLAQARPEGLATALELEQVLGVGPALVFLADQILDRYLHVGEEDLIDLVAQGRFRQDLLFRVNTIEVRLPPLRERQEDIIPIAYRRLAALAAARAAGVSPWVCLHHFTLPGWFTEMGGGFVDDRAAGDHLGYRGLPLLGTTDEAADISARESIDHLYVALPPEQHVQMLQLIESTSRECVDVKVVPDLLQVIALRARLEDLDGIPVININDVPLQGFNAMLKRGIDIAISAAALVVIAIPFWLVAALVKLSSRGDVFYRQERMGLDGKPFMIYKFRSMYDDAEAETGPVFASEQDPRRTPLGKLLRRSNVDELPQLWNVLRGDMSFVGPRPERPEFCVRYERDIHGYAERQKVRPGVTGYAQVNGEYHTSPSTKLKYDLAYIYNRSFWLDLKILSETVKVIMTRRGV